MENKLVAGAVVSTKTTNQEDLTALLALGDERLVIVEECPTLRASINSK